MSTIDKALSVLELFSESRPSIGLSEASRLLRRDKATVQRYLTVLNERGFLDQDALTRAYHLGPAVTRLSLVRDLTYPVKTGVTNILRKLVVDTGETAHASHSQQNGELSVVAIEETSFKGTRVYIDPAAFLPLHASASGIAFLSALSEDTADEFLIRPLETFTPSTAKNRKEVFKLVHQARERGYAKMAGTFEIDVVGMAAPVYGFDKQACGAVAVATPASRFNKGVEQRNRACLVDAADAVSQLYGAKLAAVGAQ